MTDRTDDWRTIFGDLTTDGVYEMCEINAYKLTSHLEELYLKIAELENVIETLRWDKIRDLEIEIENLNYKLENYD
jgi:hypothetical protein